MVTLTVSYTSSKKCEIVHELGHSVNTDAPKDIGGDASACSPTDLIVAALAACVLTTVGMFAERHQIDLSGMTSSVTKEMSTSPRRIGRIGLTVHFPTTVPDDMRATLEKVGNGCPVKASLHPEVDVQVTYLYDVE
jgi:putative redox protein